MKEVNPHNTESSAPPKYTTRFLRWFLHPDYWEDIQGDLQEEFELQKNQRSIISASNWYRWQVLRLFRPAMMRRPDPIPSLENSTTMFRNYLKIGFRNLWKYKSSTFINVIGLTTGLTAFLLISIFVKDELSYDRHHEKGANLYRVTVKNFDQSGALSRHWAFASSGHSERLKEDYAAITHSTRFYCWAFPDLTFGSRKFPGEQVVFADDDVFDMFTFPFLIGDPETAFEDIFSLVLTESTAVKIFGNDWQEKEILGQTVELSRGSQSAPFKVTGVMADMPDQQHFHFDYLAPIRFLEQLFGEDAMNNVGGNYNWLTYILLDPNVELPDTQTLTEEFFDKYMGKIRGGVDAHEFYGFEFQPLYDIHLNSNLEGEYETNGDIQQVYLFSVIGILLLLVACVNYMNLATSHYSRRMKEVGVRKAIGARKSTLIKQFLTESSLVTILSFPVAVLLAYLFLPYVNDFLEKKMSFELLFEQELLFIVLSVMLAVGVVAGSYPALFLSRINLIQALKGEQAMNARKWNFRSWLVTFQYAVTISLIFAILVIEAQMSFIHNSDPGFRREQILELFLSRNINDLDVFKNELLKLPAVDRATYASRIPTGRLSDSMGASIFKGDSAVRTDFRLPFIRVDEDFLSTFEIELIAGDDFRKDQSMERDSIGYYIINRTAAERMGYLDPQNAVGKRLSYGRYNGQMFRVGRILGVVEDFNFESIKSPIVPMLMMKSDNPRRICLKMNTAELQTTLRAIEELWNQFDPDTNARYRFVDESFANQYDQETKLSSMLKVFTIIAILIACLGLIGMVGFIIETKLKEIGIRKVLGASTGRIMYLIGNQFMMLIAIAFAVALPLAYFLMSDWLESFAYRVSISVLIIIAPIFLASLLTLAAISYQTIKASMSNPVLCLKDE